VVCRTSLARTRVSAKPAQPPAAPGSRAPTIIYIAGSGRSGSTLLERALGQVPGFVSVGELIDLFRHTPLHRERCGCGEVLARCPFWVRVGSNAFGGWEDGRLAEIHALQHRVARQRHMLRLLAIRLAGSSFRSEVARYGTCCSSLYRTIATEAQAACIVDASKWPAQALALFRGGVDIRVIHLVRDVRGVAHSLSKRDVPRPHAVGETSVMWRNGPATAAARWVACQLQAELLRCCSLPVMRVHYEDFVQDPRRTIEVALTALGLSHESLHLTHVNGQSVNLVPGHGLAGNPSRFQAGEIHLRSDDEWRKRMSWRDRTMVTVIALPLLLRYGWRRRPKLGAGLR
jgi:hypothetical protein